MSVDFDPKKEPPLPLSNRQTYTPPNPQKKTETSNSPPRSAKKPAKRTKPPRPSAPGAASRTWRATSLRTRRGRAGRWGGGRATRCCSSSRRWRTRWRSVALGRRGGGRSRLRRGGIWLWLRGGGETVEKWWEEGVGGLGGLQ